MIRRPVPDRSCQLQARSLLQVRRGSLQHQQVQAQQVSARRALACVRLQMAVVRRPEQRPAAVQQEVAGSLVLRVQWRRLEQPDLQLAAAARRRVRAAQQARAVWPVAVPVARAAQLAQGPHQALAKRG